MKKLVCIGESLIDFMAVDGDELTFKANAGGAPANVCACVSKLGGQSCYLGKLSKDIFSRFLLHNMQCYGIDTSFVAIDGRYPTALAFVSHDDRGDREFNFYRTNTCDLMLDEDDVREDMLDKGDILHFCSVCLVESKTKQAHIKAIKIAKDRGALVSFDVNIRENLWDSLDSCVKTVKEFLSCADIVKVSQEELVAITKEQDYQKSVRMMFDMSQNCKILLVTKGENGAECFDRDMQSFSTLAKASNVVDTTGAGDCFIGSVLYCLLYKNCTLDIQSMTQATTFASFACAQVVGRKGAMQAMPTYDQVGYDWE